MPESSSERMQIGELANQAGVSQRTIHYYESLGILRPTKREGQGYRYYDHTALERLHKINVLKKLGLSLDEISQVIDLYFEDPGGIRGKQQVLVILEKHLAETDERLSELQKFRDDLIASIALMKAYIAAAKGS